MMDLSGHEIQIPIPISAKYIGDHGGHGSKIIHEPHHHPSSNGPPPPPPPPPFPPTNIIIPADETHQNNNSNKKRMVVKYRECLKNHAASIGGNATDGCGEFMPNGEEGSVEALKCSACNCHRNFHRKEVEGESSIELYNYNHYHHKGRKMVGQKGVLISGSDPFGYTSAHNGQLIPMPSPHHMIMPLGAIQTSESEEMEGCGGMMSRQQPMMMKKRFRTKFTLEQKEKMLSFAERVGWRLQKQEDGVVQQFCQEIGVKRRVLKVWMHNNKHSLAKKGSFQLDNSG